MQTRVGEYGYHEHPCRDCEWIGIHEKKMERCYIYQTLARRVKMQRDPQRRTLANKQLSTRKVFIIKFVIMLRKRPANGVPVYSLHWPHRSAPNQVISVTRSVPSEWARSLG